MQLLAWDVNDRSPRLFTKWAYEHIPDTSDAVDHTMSLLNMTWASASTPMYFKPAKIEDKYYISGDNAARSPAMFSYLHAHLSGIHNMTVVSVGSTNEKSTISEGQSPIAWLSSAFDLGMPVKVHTMDYMTDYMLRRHDGKFYKFEVQTDSDFENSLYYDYDDRTKIMEQLTSQMIQYNWVQATTLITDMIHERFDCTH